jgi:hypothetical protein
MVMKFSAMSILKDSRNFNLRYGQNFEFVKLLCSVQNRNFSSTRQLSEIITPGPLVVLGCVNDRWKDENVSYNIGI